MFIMKKVNLYIKIKEKMSSTSWETNIIESYAEIDISFVLNNLFKKKN